MTRQEQKEARRQAILMKALELFVTKGYYETKINDIAEGVKMSVGLLFHYFDSKEQLFYELVKMGVEGTKYPEELGKLPPEQFFDTFLKQCFEFASKQPWVFQMFVLIGQARREGMPEDARKLALSISQIEFSAKIIAKGQKSGVFKKGNAMRMSQCFWACVQGVMEQMASDKDFKAPDPGWLTSMLKV